MAPLSPATRNITDNDELDDILNGIIEDRDMPDLSNAQTQPPTASMKNTTRSDGLGVDEEIVITKKRLPAPKLDDHRLLSDPGIPKLRRISKERLRFKGKGHEYGDIARMLNMYQLWLDDLYPRAKFADALAIIEKVGHSRRMQMMRKDWIDEGKPKRSREDEEEIGQGNGESDDLYAQDIQARREEIKDSVNRSTEKTSSQTNEKMDASEEDMERLQQNGDPDEDELDALLAEETLSKHSAPKTLPVRTAVDDDPFADEMDVIADMEDMW